MGIDEDCDQAKFFCKLERSEWPKLDLFIRRILDSLFETISPAPFFLPPVSFVLLEGGWVREISNRIATSGNSKQERDKKGCGRDGRDRRNPIARITDKYERLERSSGSHPPSTISPLSLHSILGYVISCRNSFFFLEGGNNRKRLDAFPRGPIRFEWNCVYPYKSMKLQDT